MTSPPNPSASQDAACSPPFVIHPPRGAPSALVLDSPHSGCHFPADFGAAISIAQLRNAEDPFVDTLFARAPDHGASLIAARFPRSYIDPNRAEGDIDLALIEGEWPDHYQPSGKAHLGKSLIWRSLKGVELVRRFSAPARQRHSLQIELNKRLYLHDGTRIRSADFARLQTQLGELMAELARTSAAA